MSAGRLWRLDVSTRRDGADLVVALAGDVDADNCATVAMVLDDLAAGAGGDVVVDLSDLGFLAVCGVTMLHDLARRLSVRGRSLRVGAVSDPVRRALGLYAGSSPTGAAVGALVLDERPPDP